MNISEKWLLTGKKALVTGGTKGIGKAIAEELLALGAEVLIVASNQAEVENTVQAWQQMHLPAHGFAADVSSPTDRQMIIQFIQEKWGKLDILINNVGTNIRKKAIEYDNSEYDHLMNTNLKATFQLSQLAYPLLKSSGSGRVVNISSVAGLKHLRTGAIYGMTKAALVQLTRNLAAEWAADNILVNCIAPWYIKTPLAETVLKNPEFLKEVLERTPQKRIGSPEEVAAATAFFCLPASGYITGQCLAVDGGFSIFGF
jgi:Tropinone reductase 1